MRIRGRPLASVLRGVAGLVGAACVVAASGLGCAVPSSPGHATEAVLFDGFSVRVPIGPDWIRQADGPTVSVLRAFGDVWTHGMLVEITVPPPLPEPVHPYDLLASARMHAASLEREQRFAVAQRGERLIRHHGMDCADFHFALERRDEIDGQARYSALLGRGLVCAHPADPRRIANLQYTVQNLDGRLLAVDQALGEAFLDSIRSRSVDTNAAPGAALQPTSDSTSDQSASRSAADSRVQGRR